MRQRRGTGHGKPRQIEPPSRHLLALCLSEKRLGKRKENGCLLRAGKKVPQRRTQ